MLQAKTGSDCKDIASPKGDRVNSVLSPWNRGDKLQQQEYVRQWCQNQQLSSPDSTPSRKVRIAESPKTPPVNVSGYSTVSTARADSTPKEVPKKMMRNGDVRRNLFLELKKRLSSPKSGHSSESDSEKKGRKVFSRLIGKKKKTSCSGSEPKKNKADSGMTTDSASVEEEDTLKSKQDSLITLDETVTTPENSPVEDDFVSVIGTERFGTPLNSSLISEDIDEVDAIPLPSGSDTPVNSMPHELFSQDLLTQKLLLTRSGARSPDSVASHMYYTCDEDAESPPMLAQALKSPQKIPPPKSVTRSKSAPRLLRVQVDGSPQKRIKPLAPQPPNSAPQSPVTSKPPTPSSQAPVPPPSLAAQSQQSAPQSSESSERCTPPRQSPMPVPPSLLASRSPQSVPESPSSTSQSPMPVPPSLLAARSPQSVPLSPVSSKSPSSTGQSASPPPPPPLPPDDSVIFKVPQRPPRRKQSLRLKSDNKENPRLAASPTSALEESLSTVFQPSIASSPCMQHAVLQYVPSASSSDSQSTTTFVNVAEEYIYTDEEHGVSLVEKRLIAKPSR